MVTTALAIIFSNGFVCRSPFRMETKSAFWATGFLQTLFLLSEIAEYFGVDSCEFDCCSVAGCGSAGYVDHYVFSGVVLDDAAPVGGFVASEVGCGAGRDCSGEAV